MEHRSITAGHWSEGLDRRGWFRSRHLAPILLAGWKCDLLSSGRDASARSEKRRGV